MAGPAPKPARRGPSVRLVVIATASALALGGLLVAAPFLIGPMVRERVIREARDRGVEMTFADMSFFWWSASFEGVRFRLVGVPGLEGTAKNIDVTLSSWEPRRISATDVHVEAVGSAADMALALGEWAKNHPKAYSIPVTATHVGVSYRASANEPPWLTVEDGAFSEGPAGGVRFAAARAVVSGLDVGAVGASWTSTSANVSMAFGTEDLARAPIQLVVQHAATPPTATVVLAPTELTRLSGPFGVPLLAPGAVASGRADFTFVSGVETGPLVGTLEAKLDGWIPPHPVELDGFVFGKTTTFTSRFDVSADRKRVRLDGSKVRAGAFELSGGGTIERLEDHAVIQMSLSGNLACAAVAQSAASAHVGSFLARILGQAARRVMEGSVSVKVVLTADSRNLAEAKVDRQIGIGCGLVPLFGLSAERLSALPAELREVARSLPLPDLDLKLPDGMRPPAPSGSAPTLPKLPSLPSGFPFPFSLPRPGASAP